MGRGQTVSRATLCWEGSGSLLAGVSASWGPAGKLSQLLRALSDPLRGLGGVRVLGSAGPTVLGQPEAEASAGGLAKVESSWQVSSAFLQWEAGAWYPVAVRAVFPCPERGGRFLVACPLLWAVFPSCSLTPAQARGWMNSGEGVRKAHSC